LTPTEVEICNPRQEYELAIIKRSDDATICVSIPSKEDFGHGRDDDLQSNTRKNVKSRTAVDLGVKAQPLSHGTYLGGAHISKLIINSDSMLIRVNNHPMSRLNFWNFSTTTLCVCGWVKSFTLTPGPKYIPVLKGVRAFRGNIVLESFSWFFVFLEQVYAHMYFTRILVNKEGLD
jgi:hypothetical protein